MNRFTLKSSTGHLAVQGSAVASALALLLVLLLAALPANAQQRESADLGRLYLRARGSALAQKHMREDVRVLPPVRERTPRLDSLRARLGLLSAAAEEPVREDAERKPLPRIRARRAVRRLGRTAFEERFAGVNWTYLGANGRAVLDTMQTRRLRARLQALYGDPTKTVVDADSLDGRPASEDIQFAYWFVVNEASDDASGAAPGEAFPVKVVDTGGPFDRGLVFSAPVRFNTRLRALREAVLAPLVETQLRARYVDYYFDRSGDTWYRAGFDGQRFFARPVDRSEVVAGQRPVLRDGS